MATVNVGDMEGLRDSFEETMGFPADAPGLELSDDQLTNFMLLCHEAMHGEGYDYDEEGEEYEDEEDMSDGKMKVKVMKLKGGDVRSMMDELLGGH